MGRRPRRTAFGSYIPAVAALRGKRRETDLGRRGCRRQPRWACESESAVIERSHPGLARGITRRPGVRPPATIRFEPGSIHRLATDALRAIRAAQPEDPA